MKMNAVNLPKNTEWIELGMDTFGDFDTASGPQVRYRDWNPEKQLP